MIGFVIGTVCLIGLAKAVRHRHHGRSCGYWGHDGGFPRGRRGRRGGFRAWGFERALDALDVSPEQEEVIRRELRTLRERKSTLYDEVERTRADVVAALRKDTLDEDALADVYVRHDELLSALRSDVVGAFGRIHAVLDDDQREYLASWLERGRGRRHDGPYRTL